MLPGNAAVCYEMGYVYQDQKQWAQAVFFYDLAVKRDDSVASFHNNRGLCKIELKEYLATRPATSSRRSSCDPGTALITGGWGSSSTRRANTKSP